jgi:methionyl-tRNA formyltransferase
VLDAPRHGCLNVHGSLLPRWRGAAPIQRAVLAGDEETGVGIMRMEAGLDTGPVLLEGRTPIGRKTTGELTAELADMGARLMVRVLADLPAYSEVPQADEGVTYASKIDKAEARLDFSQSAEQVERQVRAFAPAPGAWFEASGERCKVLAANVVEGSGTPGMVLDDLLTIACGSDAIRPGLVQRAGRPAMATADLLRGWAISAGMSVS